MVNIYIFLEAAMTIFTYIGILVLEDMGESPYDFSGVFVPPIQA